MSRIPVINEISFPRDSRVLAQFREVARPATASRTRGVCYFQTESVRFPLGPHKIRKLSARYGRVIYAAEIEADLRVVFYIEGNTVVTVDIGSHDLYR
jgi:hypothetical protein